MTPARSTETQPLDALRSSLPARPAASLDRALDALATCLARHGPERTSMTDVAREMGVARSTLYKHVGSIEQASWALLVREAYRFFDAFGDIVENGAGPRAVVHLTAQFVQFVGEHPVVARMLRDEPMFVGELVTRGAAPLVDACALIVTPLVASAMDAGMLRRVGPTRLAQWLGRIVAALVIAPPAGDVEELLEEMLLPLLEP